MTTSELALSTHHDTVAHLSRASVKKHFDAYADIAWDSEEFAVDPADPRWELAADDPLGATAWYREQPQTTRARIGLDMLACKLKTGIEFENILSRGLLEFALSCKNGSPEYRYAYHEVIEEGQHSLMFQECVNRTGYDAPGLHPLLRATSRSIPRLGRVFPEMFFMHVLAGEVPIDRVQRADLRRGALLHPMQRRIEQIHVTEEARHVRFAESYLETHVPRLPRYKLLELRLVSPFATAIVANLMLKPPAQLFAQHRVPKRVVSAAYSGPVYHALLANSVGPLSTLHAELGIATKATIPLYKALRIWPTGPVQHTLSSGQPPLLAQ